jgi:hypothetical protein
LYNITHGQMTKYKYELNFYEIFEQ